MASWSVIWLISYNGSSLIFGLITARHSMSKHLHFTVIQQQKQTVNLIVRNGRVIKSLDIKYPQATSWGRSHFRHSLTEWLSRCCLVGQSKVIQGFKSRSAPSESQSSCFIWAVTPTIQYGLVRHSRTPPPFWSLPKMMQHAPVQMVPALLSVTGILHYMSNCNNYFTPKLTINNLKSPSCRNFLPLILERIIMIMNKASLAIKNKKEGTKLIQLLVCYKIA